MHKKIALMLVVVLLIGMLPQSFQFADDEPERNEYNFIKEDNFSIGTDMKDNKSPGLDETTLQWEFKDAGIYKLEYYIKNNYSTENENTAQKVEIEFEVGGDSKIITSIQVEGADKIENYKKHKFPYTEGLGWEVMSNDIGDDSPGVKYNGLKLNGIRIEETQLSLMIQNQLKIRLRLDGKVITLTTSNIKKGYITPFRLSYQTSELSTNVVTKEIIDFKGFEEFEITPTHLEDGTLQSDYLIKYPDRAGTKPGVRVSIKKPYYINGNEFQLMNNEEGKKFNISLALWPQFKLNQTQADNEKENLILNFDFGDNSSIGKTGKKTYTARDSYVELFVSKPIKKDKEDIGEDIQEYIVEWENLNESTVINGNIQIGYKKDANSNKEYLGGKLYSPENLGYTFLDYKASKSGEQEVELSLKPYNMNSKVIYTVYKKRVNIGTDFDKEVTHEDLTNTGNWIKQVEYISNKIEDPDSTIPIGIAKAVEQEYVITVQLENQSKSFISQRLYFSPSDIQAPPKVTQIINIDKIYAIENQVNGETNSSMPIETAGFDLEWNAPKLPELISLLEKGDLYYEFLVRDQKGQAESPQVLKVFKVSPKDRANLHNSSDIKVEVVAGTAKNDGEGYPVGSYYSDTGTFKVPGIVLKNVGQSGWEQIVYNTSYPYENLEEYPTFEVKNNLYKQIPGTYYFSMRTVLVMPGESVVCNTEESNLYSASIGITNKVVPTVENIRTESNLLIYKEENRISENIIFNNVDIRDYVDSILKPAGWNISSNQDKMYGGVYELFLYTLSDGNKQYTESELDVAANSGYKSANPNQVNRFDLSQEDLAKLRKNGVIAMQYNEENMTDKALKSLVITGLDPNQVYYVTMRVKVIAYRGDNNEEKTEKTSILSPIYSFTTSTEPVAPKPEDKIPPAPNKFYIIDQPNNTSVNLGWDKADIELGDGVTKIYYEIVRGENTPLTDTELERKNSLESLVSGNSHLVGFDTKDLHIRMLKYGNNWNTIVPEQLSSSFKLKDYNLVSNTIYYYYIRTVSIIGEEKVNSTWIRVPVTTKPVEAPYNLKIESDKNNNYDPRYATMISFDAIIPESGKYEFEIEVKGEDDKEYSTTKYSSNKWDSYPNEDTTGSMHFVYKITGLESNKRYNIRVRLVDKTRDEEEGEFSSYSEVIMTRTEYDEQDAFEEEKYQEYLKIFDLEAQKLKNKSYWEVGRSGTYKYRASYINTDIALNNIYQLINDNDQNQVTYYLPASVLNSVNESSTTLEVSLGAYDFYIRPNTLTLEDKVIKEVAQKVTDRKLQDYYIAISANKINKDIRISNQEVISPQLELFIEVVEVRDKEQVIEANIMESLVDLIAIQRLSFIKDLDRQISRGNFNVEQLQDLVAEHIETIQSKHIVKVQQIMNKTVQKTTNLSEVEKSILLIAAMEAIDAQAYFYASTNNWVKVESYVAKEGYAVEFNLFGSYIFTGREPLINIVPSIAPYQSMINKYNLTEFFELTPYMIKTATTKEQLYGAVARVLEVKQGNDYATILKNKGIKGVSSIGQKQAIRQDEAIYILMQAYEMIHGRKVTSVTIKNRQSIQNIGAFQSIYRDYVYAGVELKIISNPNGKVLPSKQLTVEETLGMLFKIQRM